ncbi:uncharacterized protein TNCV_3972651 [Trichonephila clavipes]|nr:uncharacterized protein TNCV_3972651 [Trichonephila clavipes]
MYSKLLYKCVIKTSEVGHGHELRRFFCRDVDPPFRGGMMTVKFVLTESPHVNVVLKFRLHSDRSGAVLVTRRSKLRGIRPLQPNLNPYDSRLWGYLKDVEFCDSITHLAEWNLRVVQHILIVTPETFRSVVEFADFYLNNGGQHIEHVLHQSRQI